MSGFQDIAAAIGIAEVAFRSICKVYEFVRDLQDAPETICRLSYELCELTHCFLALQSLEGVDRKTCDSLEKIGLPRIVNRCGTACAKLENDLKRWSRGGNEALYTRLRIRFNKSRIQGVTEEIGVAKQTLTLAVTISIHLQQGNILTTMDSIQMSRSSTLVSEMSQNQEKDLALRTTQLQSADGTKQVFQHQHLEKVKYTSTTASIDLKNGGLRAEPAEKSEEVDKHDVQGNEVTRTKGLELGVLEKVSVKSQVIRDNKIEDSERVVIGKIIGR